MAFVAANIEWTPVLHSSAIVAEPNVLPYYLPSEEHAGNCANPLLFASSVEPEGAASSFLSECGPLFKSSLASGVRT